MSVDIVIYAVVAAGLALWLRSLLGTRNGAEITRMHPLTVPSKGMEETLSKEGDKDSEKNAIDRFLANPPPRMAIHTDAIEGLKAIIKKDSTFIPQAFLEAAGDVFALVTEDFAKGDEESLADLLDTSTHAIFVRAIQDRKAKGHTQTTQVRAITQATIVAARVEKNNQAFITVQFLADEVGATYNENKELIEGHPSHLSQTKGQWVFSRTLQSKDPRWLVIETRGES